MHQPADSTPRSLAALAPLAPEPPARTSGAAFAYVTTLFFAWGFATSLVDPLIAAVRHVFSLSYTEAFLTTFAWFIAYGAASLPAAALLARLGYSRAILGALGVMVAGCLLVTCATLLDFYPGVLFALFVVASGVTLLQVAANPLVAELGPRKTASFRLNISQGFNSLGTTIAPWVGAHLLLTGGIFAAGAVVTAAMRAESLRGIGLAFGALGAFFAVVAGFLYSARVRIDAAAPKATESSSPLAALKSRWALLGALAIFVYVGSEVTIGSTLTLFLSNERVLDLPLETAGKMVAYYWGGAMVGRFVGGAILARAPAGLVLAICTVIAAVLCAVVTQSGGVTAAYAALSVGLFNSIMFPSIFTLTLERSTAPTSSTSGLLVFGIIGGALLPQLGAAIADRTFIGHVFYVPLVGYVLLTAFAIACMRSKPKAAA